MAKTRVVAHVRCVVCGKFWWANYEEGTQYIDCDACGCSMPLDTVVMSQQKKRPDNNSEEGIRCTHIPRGIHYHIWGGPRDGEVICHTKGPLPEAGDSFLIDGRCYVMEDFPDGKLRAVDHGVSQ